MTTISETKSLEELTDMLVNLISKGGIPDKIELQERIKALLSIARNNGYAEAIVKLESLTKKFLEKENI